MSSAYNGTNAVRIILKTKIDFSTTAPTAEIIEYTDPNDTSSTWTASILTGSEASGKIYYDLTTSETLSTGRWYVRAKLTYSDGRVLYTEKKYFDIGS